MLKSKNSEIGHPEEEYMRLQGQPYNWGQKADAL